METNLIITVVINLIAGLGVFLLGMKYMSEGLQAVAGSGLRRMIRLVTDNRFLAVLVGIVVTCTVQSSSITTVMVVGLVNSGFMVLKQALGVIFGANIGTTITGWILTLKIGKFGLPILGLSAFLFLFSRNERLRYTGMAIMGIGMIFFGLELMKNGLKPIRSEPEFLAWFEAFRATTFLGQLKCAAVGCILTMIVQSSSATLAITMGLAASGVIGFETAAALVLGENVGTTITALLASLGANTTAKRAAYGHMIFNILGVVWIMAIFPIYLKLIVSILGHDPNLMVLVDGKDTYPHIMPAIALVHTVFNVANTLLFIPFIKQIAWLTTKMAPDKAGKETPHLTHLDIRILDTPSLGIEQSRKELEFMGESVDKMIGMLGQNLTAEKPSKEIERKLFHREEVLDNVQKEVTVFLGSLLSGQITHEVMESARSQLRIADEYESISDYISNVQKLVIKLRKKELQLADQDKEEILELHNAVDEYLKMITKAVREENRDILSKANTQGDEIKKKMKGFRQSHLERLPDQEVNPLKSLIFTDMLNAYRKMKDHGVNIAEALAGEK